MTHNKTHQTHWRVVVEATETGVALLPIPPEVMALAQWRDQQEVEISVGPSGTIILARPCAPRKDGHGLEVQTEN